MYRQTTPGVCVCVCLCACVWEWKLATKHNSFWEGLCTVRQISYGVHFNDSKLAARASWQPLPPYVLSGVTYIETNYNLWNNWFWFVRSGGGWHLWGKGVQSLQPSLLHYTNLFLLGAHIHLGWEGLWIQTRTNTEPLKEHFPTINYISSIKAQAGMASNELQHKFLEPHPYSSCAHDCDPVTHTLLAALLWHLHQNTANFMVKTTDLNAKVRRAVELTEIIFQVHWVVFVYVCITASLIVACSGIRRTLQWI